MKDFDVVVIGAGASAYGFLKGLEQNPLYKDKSIGVICPKKYLETTPAKIDFKASPKFLQKENVLRASYWKNSFAQALKSDGFEPIGVHGIGGMARIWGSSYAVFSDVGLEKNGFDVKSFRKNYKLCSDFLPLSGNKNDHISDFFDDIPKSESVNISDRIGSVYGTFCNERLKVGYPRLMLDVQADKNCRYSKDPFNDDIVWSPKERDFKDIQLNIKFIQGVVSKVLRENDFYQVIIDRDDNVETITTKVVILSAGVIQNYRLLSPFSRDKRAKLVNTPALAFGFLNLTNNQNGDFFGMGNATFALDDKGEIGFYGNLYDGDSLGLSKGKVFSHLFIKDKILKFLVRKMVVGAGFISSEHSQCSISSDDSQITIKGEFCESYYQIVSRIKKALRLYGKEKAGILAQVKKARLGEDIHYGGGIPEDLYAKELSVNGALKGLENIRVIGGSTFNYLPPFSPTLSFIANSYRIGQELK